MNCNTCWCLFMFYDTSPRTQFIEQTQLRAKTKATVAHWDRERCGDVDDNAIVSIVCPGLSKGDDSESAEWKFSPLCRASEEVFHRKFMVFMLRTRLGRPKGVLLMRSCPELRIRPGSKLPDFNHGKRGVFLLSQRKMLTYVSAVGRFNEMGP